MPHSIETDEISLSTIKMYFQSSMLIASPTQQRGTTIVNTVESHGKIKALGQAILEAGRTAGTQKVRARCPLLNSERLTYDWEGLVCRRRMSQPHPLLPGGSRLRCLRFAEASERQQQHGHEHQASHYCWYRNFL